MRLFEILAINLVFASIFSGVCSLAIEARIEQERSDNLGEDYKFRPRITDGGQQKVNGEQLRGRYNAGEVPDFPPDIPSCVACQPSWSSISSCAEAAPVFQNASNIIWNPLAFVSAIKCACTDTFSSAYPQCVDCFVQTNQCETFLGVGADSAPSIVQGIRSVCGFGSAILGGVQSSQTAANISYTYVGQPAQPGATATTGPGGYDVTSEEGASSAIDNIHCPLNQLILLLCVGVTWLLTVS